MTKRKSMRMSNSEFARTNEPFIKACKDAGIPATGRQAGKWRRKTGLAYQLKEARK